MEIHPPEHPIRSVRDFVVQLFTVTCGILIALGLEGRVEHRRDAALAKQTLEAFVTDITPNLQRIQREHDAAVHALPVLKANIAYLEAKQKHVTAKDPGNLSGFSLLYLRNAPWDSALATQGVRLLTQHETETISRVYAGQTLHNSMIDQLRAELAELESYGDDTDSLTPDELRQCLRTLRMMASTGATLIDMDTQMLAHYQEALAAIKAAGA
jgi:hypothetical protein